MRESRRVKISAVIIAFNEEKKIADAILSVDWADDVLVVDSESTDHTREIAESLGARVIVNPWPGFSEQKQFATDHAKHEWIFSLDADERVSENLKAELISFKRCEPSLVGFKIPRLSYYMGRPIKYSGWYPDWQLRLFDRRKGRWSQVLIHESFKLDGGEIAGRLKADIIHVSIDNIRQHHVMIGERYAPLAARQMFENGKRTSPLQIATRGPLSFISTYILKAGFLDGLAGFTISKFAAYHAFLKHLILWELQNSDRAGDDG